MERGPRSTRREAAVVRLRRLLALVLAAGVGACCQPVAGPEAGAPASCGDGMTPVQGRFCVDVYEASLVEVEAGVERPHRHNLPVGEARVRAVSLPGVLPQAFISQREAAGACAAAGKRLCTDDEWQTACSEAGRYPYGRERRPGACNDEARVAPLVQLFGRRPPGTPYTWKEMNDPRLGEVAGALAKTGQFVGCRSADGAMDLVGNLHEWTAHPGGTFRGGFFGDTRQHGEGCSYETTAHDAGYRDYSVGFRCCRDLPASPR